MDAHVREEILKANASSIDSPVASLKLATGELNSNILCAIQTLVLDRCYISITAFDDILFESHEETGDAVVIAYKSGANFLQLAQWCASEEQFVEPDPAVTSIPIIAVGLLNLLCLCDEDAESALSRSRIALLGADFYRGEIIDQADMTLLTERVCSWIEGLDSDSSTLLSEPDIRLLGRGADNAVAQFIFKKLVPITMPENKEPAWFFKKAELPFGPHGGFSGMPAHATHPTLCKLREELALEVHDLSEREQSMIAKLDENYVPDERIIRIAQTIKDDWHLPMVDLAPNIIFEGDSGSGKTAATKFLSYVWGLPRTKITLSPTFESVNLIGAFYPVVSRIDAWDIQERDKAALRAIECLLRRDSASLSNVCQGNDAFLAFRRALGSPEARDAIRECYDIPTAEEALFDPENAWRRLGRNSPTPDSSSIVLEADRSFDDVVYRLLMILAEKEREGSVRYEFVESELMRAFRNGWLVEIQEASSVLRPGVLTELNSLLEPGGSIELPHGERIVRHPDTVVIITSNRDYIGTMDLNESLRDRCVLGEKMDLPPVEVMTERAMAQTGFANRRVVREAATAICAVNAIAKERNIRGAFGMRSLIGWVLDLKRGDYSLEAFKRRVLYKMTTREEDIEILVDAYQSTCAFETSNRGGRRDIRE